MVFEKLKKILCDQLDIDQNSISMDSLIIDDLNADSLDIIDIIMSIEEEFDLDFQDDQIDNFKTVGDIVHHIEKNLQ